MSFLKNKSLKLIVIFVLCTFLLFILNISRNYLDFDDSLNYHFIRGILNGLVPYNDLNIIITPLFHYVGALFLLVFGSSVYIFYLYGSMIVASIFLLIYMIFEKKIDDIYLRRMFYVLLLLFLYVLSSPNYNTLFFIFTILIILIEIFNNFKSSYLKHFVIGVLLGLSVLSKQSYGIYIVIGYYLFLLFSQFKKGFLKKAFFVTTGGLLIASLFVIYLIAFNNFNSFIDYCMGGINDFASNNGYYYTGLTLAPIIVNILAIVLSIICYIKSKNNIFLLGCFLCISSTFFVFPLGNTYHVVLSIIIPFIFLSFIVQFFSKGIKYDKAINLLHVICESVFYIIIIILLYITLKHSLHLNYYDISDPYSKLGSIMNISKEQVDNIIKVDEYIVKKKNEGYDVFILSANASLYYLPINVFTEFDLITYGNLGSGGVDQTINRLSNIKKPLFLKAELGQTTYQEPKELEDFVVNNYKMVGEIGDFRIFTK